MQRTRMLMLALLALLAFGAFASAVASAEDGQPAILILEGNVSELEFLGEGTGSTLSVLNSANLIAATAIHVHLKGCLSLGGSSLDANLCHEGTLEYTGWKIGANKCHSENAKGEKDPAEVVLAIFDAHLAAELSTEKVLEPLLVMKLLGVDGNDLKINCTLIVTVLGRLGCLLLPGLSPEEVTKVEILCKTDLTTEKPNGDQLTGECTQTETLCKELKEDPFAVTFGKKGEVEAMAAMLVHVKGEFNKMVLIDD